MSHVYNDFYIDNIIELYEKHNQINCSKYYIKNFLNKLFDKIKKNLTQKMAANGYLFSENCELFDKKYDNFMYNFMSNLDPNSNMNIKISDGDRHYLIVNLYKYMKFSLISSKINNKYTLLKIHNCITKDDNFNLKKIMRGNIFYLNPSINQKYVKKIELKSQQKVKKTNFTLYTCKKCKKNNTEIRRMQTRSGDEGYTMFVTCLECDNNWKIAC